MKKWLYTDIEKCYEVNTLKSMSVPGLSYSARQIVERFGLPPIEESELTVDESYESPLYSRPLDQLDAVQSLRDWVTVHREKIEQMKKADIDALEQRRLASVQMKNESAS